MGHRAVVRAPARVRWPQALANFGGLLLIGDEALHILRAGVYPHSYDLGEEWRLRHRPADGVRRLRRAARVPGRARRTRPRAVEAALVASRDRCAAHPLETAAAAAQLYDFSAAYLDHYFDQLKFGFPPEYRRGLAEFYRRAQAIGELDARARPRATERGGRAPGAAP